MGLHAGCERDMSADTKQKRTSLLKGDNDGGRGGYREFERLQSGRSFRPPLSGEWFQLAEVIEGCLQRSTVTGSPIPGAACAVVRGLLWHG